MHFILYFITCFVIACSPFPNIEALVPAVGKAGDVIDIRDSNWASLSPEGTVYFGNVIAPKALLWTPEDVYLQVPSGITSTVPVVVSIEGHLSNIRSFSLVDNVDFHRIMCFGDSIFHWGVPQVVQNVIDEDEDLNTLGLVALDQSKSGERVTGEDTWARWQNAMNYSDPDLVILLEGTNDVSDNVNASMTDIQQSLTDMIDEALLPGVDLVLCTLLPRVGSCGDSASPTTQEFNAWLRSYAEGIGVPVADLYEDFLSTPDWQNLYFGTDCIHPNANGRKRIAELLSEQLRKRYLPPCTDLDEDGYGDPSSPMCPFAGVDCDDSDPKVNPGMEEAPSGDPICSDEIDNDCDGDADALDLGCME